MTGIPKPDVVPADNDACRHMMRALRPENREGEQACLGFWRTPLGIVVKSAQSNLDVRGRYMMRWLASLGRRIRVVEELIDAWIPSEGHASPMEKHYIPIA